MKKPSISKRVCIISFSPIYRDGRVLRQIKYLSPHYDLTVIGYGPPHPDLVKLRNITWVSIDYPGFVTNEAVGEKQTTSFKHFLISSFLKNVKMFISHLLLFLGRSHPSFYGFCYWRQRRHIQAFQHALQSNCNAFHANDWEALPVAAEAAKKLNAQLVFDSHEYAPLELENRLYWKVFIQPEIIYFIKKYTSQINSSITVAPLISERYKKEFNLETTVVLNIPESVPLAFRTSDFNHIRLIHHGGAIRDRRLESLIETVALCDRRYSLHFMLTNNDANYLKSLKKMADEMIPGCVTFHEPVAPEEVIHRISEYDIGFCLIAPTNYNYLVSLPNKFFDYVMAGLAICIGPSPSMAEIVKKYGMGCIAPSFDPKDIAKMLSQLTGDQISKMRLASRNAAKEINAEKEKKKIVDIYDQLLNSH